MSEWLEGFLQDRETALEQGNLEEAKEIRKKIKKFKQLEREEYIMETIDKDLDVRDKWSGIRELKTPYKPIPYSQRRKDGTKKNRGQSGSRSGIP